MDPKTKQILRGQLAPFALTLAAGVSGPAHAHDTYQLSSVDYTHAVSITDGGIVGADNWGGSSAILEGPIAATFFANASITGVSSNYEAAGLLNGGDTYYYDGLATNTLPSASLRAMSDAGLAVGGGFSFVTLAYEAIEWSGAGLPVVLARPAGWPDAYATDVSDDSRFVVGSAYGGGNSIAVLWDRQLGAVHPLSDTVTLVGGGLHTGWSTGEGVNEAGDVVGSIDGEAVVWTMASGWAPQHLGDMPGMNPSDGCYPFAINDEGIAVGYCGAIGDAFIWHPGDTSLTPLIDEVDPSGSAGWTLNRAYDINDAGQIVGFGVSPAGFYRGFVLAPEDACLRPCTFSDGTTLQWPIGQCEALGGELPWAVTYCIEDPGPGPVMGP